MHCNKLSRLWAQAIAAANDVCGIGVMMTLNRNIASDLDTLAQ
jgi:hypothetical protein